MNNKIRKKMNKDVKKEVFIISGMSGAGKSTALNFLEDYDFEIVDNLPLNLPYSLNS